jgi:hypothetical protein
MAQQPLDGGGGLAARGNRRHAGDRLRQFVRAPARRRDGAQAHAGFHVGGQALEQRLARELGGFGFGGRTRQETGQRRGQHVQPARPQAHLRTGIQRQQAALGLRARDFQARVPRDRRP